MRDQIPIICAQMHIQHATATILSPLAQKAKSAAVFDVSLFCICHDMGFRKRRAINMENMIHRNCCTMKPMNFVI